MKRRSQPTLQVAVALVAGFVAGMVLRSTPIPGFIEPVGTLWINAIRMPILPLIVTMLIASIAGSTDSRRIGVLGARSLAVMLALLSLFAVIMTPLAQFLLGGIEFDPASTASLREAARFDASVLQQVTLREWLLSQESVMRAGLSDHGLHLHRLLVQRDPRHERRDAPEQEQKRARSRRSREGDAHFEVSV